MPKPLPESRNLLRRPPHPDITEELVHQLVHTFYGKIREDRALGPIFDRVIGDRWDTHLEKMHDFWSSVVLVNGRYQGRPLPAHMRLKDVRPEHFTLWLELFRETAEEVCPPGVAPIFIDRAERIAESFQLGMFYRPDDPRSVPLPSRGE